MSHKSSHNHKYTYTACVYDADEKLIRQETVSGYNVNEAIHPLYCSILKNGNDGAYRIDVYNSSKELVTQQNIPPKQNFTFRWYSEDMSSVLKEVIIPERFFDSAEAQFREMVHQEIGYISFNYAGFDEEGNMLHEEKHPIKTCTIEVYDKEKCLGSFEYKTLSESEAFMNFLREHPFPDKNIEAQYFSMTKYENTGEIHWMPFASRKAQTDLTGEIRVLVMHDEETIIWQEQKLNDFLSTKDVASPEDKDTPSEEKDAGEKEEDL